MWGVVGLLADSELSRDTGAGTDAPAVSLSDSYHSRDTGAGIDAPAAEHASMGSLAPACDICSLLQVCSVRLK